MSRGDEVHLAKLREDLERFWKLVERHLAAANEVDPHDGRPSMAVVAVDLHHAYQAFESLLEKLEGALALPMRTGAAWHEAILNDAAAAIPDQRPVVVPPEALDAWHAVRKFRHFFRHGSVAVEFDPDELSTVRTHLDHAVRATGPAVRALLSALG